MSQIIVHKDETLRLPMLWTGKETDLSYNVVLNEPGASVYFTGLLLGKGAHNLKLKINIIHAAPNTTSDVNIKAALGGSCSVTIEGLVTIQAGAKDAKTWLAARMLLLSGNAKGLATPSLEILEDEVKAGHATTIGRVSESELFYLISRGLSRAEATQCIVQGFVRDIIDSLPSDMAKCAKKELHV